MTIEVKKSQDTIQRLIVLPDFYICTGSIFLADQQKTRFPFELRAFFIRFRSFIKYFWALALMGKTAENWAQEIAAGNEV